MSQQKKNKSMINDLTATPLHHGENPIYKTFVENSTNVSIKRLALQMNAC